MRNQGMWLAAVIAIGLTGCTERQVNSNAREAGREAQEAKQETKSAAREAGRAAHELAQETKEAAAKAGHVLKKAGKEAKAGWEEAKQDSRSRKEDPKR